MGAKEGGRDTCSALNPVKMECHATQGKDSICKSLPVSPQPPQPTAARQEGRQRTFYTFQQWVVLLLPMSQTTPSSPHQLNAQV